MNTILTDDEISDLAMQSGAYDEQLLAFARAVEAAVLTKLARQEPVAVVPIHPKDGPLWAMTTDVPDSERLPSYPLMPIYVAPKAPPQADRQRVPVDLKNRCVEILGWKKTGVLTGNALRDFAKQKYCDETHALQMAEAETAREAYRVIAAMLTATPEAPAQASAVDERVAFEAELRRQCFQKPTTEARDLAWCMWQARAALAQKECK